MPQRKIKVEERRDRDRIKQLAASIMQARGEGSEKGMNAAERPAIHPAGPAARRGKSVNSKRLSQSRSQPSR